jgi:alpha-glucosidase
MKRIAFVFVLSAMFAPAQTDTELASPDGQLKIAFQTLSPPAPAPGGRGGGRGTVPAPAGAQLQYHVTFHGRPLVDNSPIQVDLEGARPLGGDMKIVFSTPSSTDETYKLVAGRAGTVRNRYKALAIDLEENSGTRRRLRVEARAYDDGVAFRYIVPDQPAIREFRMTGEETEFRIAKDGTAYALELSDFRTMYESEYVKLPVSAFASPGGTTGTRLIGLPTLIDVPGVGWMAITEADMRGSAAMYLFNPGQPGRSRLKARIAPSSQNPDIAVSGPLPHHSAWRTILVADQPVSLLESNIITSLNPPPTIADTAWIHPGKSSWDWWSGSLDPEGKPAFTTENLKTYVDFSAKSGFEYMLVDAGWSAQGDITKMNGRVDIPELVRYAAAKNVKVWIWCHWTGIDAQLNEAFPLYEKWGVAGVKIDFMSRDDQTMTEFYYRVAETAARYHLMVDFHGATKPTGMERTWPNVLGYEAVLGMEQSKWGMRDNPDSHINLAFTRMLAGMMDYTPGGFENVTRDQFVGRNAKPMVMGTRAHQLAMYAIYEAPFQMVSDYPHAYEDQPAFEFIKAAPATWDETRGINGVVGEYVTIARRRGNTWFLGSMTNWSPRQLDIPLAFLGNGRYTAEIYADSTDADRYPKNVSIRKQTVDRNTHLKADLAPGGGLAVRFVPAP